ncbi:uncharacterized protein LOC128723787 [Anopheles nili]|uniref:uncharacterized protein LOC128723787 n=1 Tax=Anopheles nili TaxID=185578 RepID=UPI00237B0CAC|nr:uncharacterized protein LOC128723787 [Anopheles nili]
MASYQLVFVLVAFVLGVWADNYVTKYDNINLEEIFNSQRLMDNYMNCLKKVGPCTPDGRELKDNLPDALMSDCAKCSEKQRIGSDKVIKFIIANRPDDFTILEQLYDPTGEYRRKYLQSDGSGDQTDEEESDRSASGGGTDVVETHASDHNSSQSQDHDHDHGEGRTDCTIANPQRLFSKGFSIAYYEPAQRSTMKLIIVVALALVAAVAAQKYTSKYDNIDVDEILKSDRLFNNYYKCLLDEGRCTPDGNELKKILPEALQTNCAKCSDKQRSGAIQVINYLIDNRKDQWNVLQKKYDPENKYIEKYREDAKKEGIKLE